VSHDLKALEEVRAWLREHEFTAPEVSAVYAESRRPNGPLISLGHIRALFRLASAAEPSVRAGQQAHEADHKELVSALEDAGNALDYAKKVVAEYGETVAVPPIPPEQALADVTSYGASVMCNRCGEWGVILNDAGRPTPYADVVQRLREFADQHASCKKKE
jgi:hypothetical protein